MYFKEDETDCVPVSATLSSKMDKLFMDLCIRKKKQHRNDFSVF